jgi:hypothetical protein
MKYEKSARIRYRFTMYCAASQSYRNKMYVFVFLDLFALDWVSNRLLLILTGRSIRHMNSCHTAIRYCESLAERFLYSHSWLDFGIWFLCTFTWLIGQMFCTTSCLIAHFALSRTCRFLMHCDDIVKSRHIITLLATGIGATGQALAYAIPWPHELVIDAIRRYAMHAEHIRFFEILTDLTYAHKYISNAHGASHGDFDFSYLFISGRRFTSPGHFKDYNDAYYFYWVPRAIPSLHTTLCNVSGHLFQMRIMTAWHKISDYLIDSRQALISRVRAFKFLYLPYWQFHIAAFDAAI